MMPGVAVLWLFAVSLAAEEMPADCRTFTDDVSHALALFAGPAQPVSDGTVVTDVLYALPLRERSSPDDFAGSVTFRASLPGRYRIAVDGLHRVDVEGPDGALAAAAFQGSPACPLMRKIVDFDLPADIDVVVTISRVAGPRARFTISGPLVD